MSERSDRDKRLGVALRELEAPDHRPGFWEQLATRLAEEDRSTKRAPRRRLVPPRRPSRWALAAAAAVVAVVAVVIGVPRTDTPEPALAEIVRERVADAIEGLETLQGRVSYRSRSEDPSTGIVDERARRFLFAFTSAGDFRFTKLGEGEIEDTAYNAETGANARYSRRRRWASGASTPSDAGCRPTRPISVRKS
jgi:hypothetical protein